MSHRVLQLFRLGVAFTFVLLLAAPVWAQYTQTVLYNFCPAGGNCTDGAGPYGGLIADAQGNLYGTTYSGGAYYNGTIFELSPPAAGSGPWTYTLLYTFCAQSNCSDGGDPYVGLVFDSKGNLYGTTSYGGSSYYGTVFELSPPAGGSGPWTYAVLYTFTGGQDGGDPFAPVIFDAAQKNLYGTTSNFDLPGGGTVFELSPPSSGAGPWTETTLHTFQANIDGNQPEGALTFDSQGNLYGTTSSGSDSVEGGVVFELSPPSGGTGPWTETVLFSSQGNSITPQNFNASLIFDAQGNLYSASGGGGPICCGDVFELSPAGSGAPWNVTNIYGFDHFAPIGSYPNAGLIFDSQGNLYGTTSEGGNTSACTLGQLGLGCGVVYAVSPPSGTGSWTENLLYTFSQTDGEGPIGNLLADSHGNLYGTTIRGGAYGQGVIYELSPIATGTAVVSSENPSTYGQGVYFTATVTPSKATGSVQFQIDGNNFGSPVPLSGGQASSATITTLAAGGHTIGALYSGTLYYGASAGSLVQTVNDAGATVGVTLITGSNPSVYGSTLTFTATLTGQYAQLARRRKGAHAQDVTGSVTWSANTSCGATPITAGVATCTTSTLPVGGDTVTATYGGDSDHSGNNGSVMQTVNAQAPMLTVTTVNPASEGYGAATPVSLTAALTWSGTGNVPGGTVKFASTAGGSFVGSAGCSVTNSTTITCTQTFNPAATDAAGVYTFSANYSTDGSYNSASSTQANNFSITQSKITPKVTITSVTPNLEPYGASLGAAVTATLSWTGSAPPPTAGKGALLSFSSAAPGSFTPALCVGKASPIVCGTLFLPVVNDPAGNYTITASYAGDSNYNAASSPQTNNFVITADSPAVKVTPNPVTVSHASTAAAALTAIFTGAGSSDAAPTGTMTFSAATGTFSGQSCTSSKDVLTCTVSYKPSGTLAAGTYHNYLTASILATGDYKAASGYANLTVTK